MEETHGQSSDPSREGSTEKEANGGKVSPSGALCRPLNLKARRAPESEMSIIRNVVGKKPG